MVAIGGPEQPAGTIKKGYTQRSRKLQKKDASSCLSFTCVSDARISKVSEQSTLQYRKLVGALVHLEDGEGAGFVAIAHVADS
jgi:hypothetical protein